MAFLDDLYAAIRDYPTANVGLGFVNVTVENGTAGAINVNEVWSFWVKVQNRGPIHMKKLSLSLWGWAGTTLSPEIGAQFTQHFRTLTRDVNATSTVYFGPYYFKAPAAATVGAKDLLSASLGDWDADLSYLLSKAAGFESAPLAHYNVQVYP